VVYANSRVAVTGKRTGDDAYTTLSRNRVATTSAQPTESVRCGLEKFSIDMDSTLFLCVLFSTNQLRGEPQW
jgi:hypothetical protein